MIKSFINRVNNIKPPRRKFPRLLWEMYDVYVKQRVARSSAALSYFVVIALFPLLICAAAILGRLNISQESVLGVWQNIVPAAALSVVTEFLGYVNGNSSTVLIVAAVGVMLTSSSAAFRTIMSIFGDIQGERRFTGIGGYIFGFVLSGAFIAVIFISAIVVLSGNWIMQWLETYVLRASIANAWLWVRFILMFLVLFFVVFALYAAAAPRKSRTTCRLPGAIAASLLMVGVSAIYSRIISASARYALVYGSLASIIVLLIWMYTCGIVVIMGNVLNICYMKVYRNGI
ncbi:MAG: YihY/virulence factor BrkB family protein [Oscillospiraceae bacterium]|nr:YihY/virulence factor BrkB family protein [Oscillospiraceae bacterium]